MNTENAANGNLALVRVGRGKFSLVPKNIGKANRYNSPRKQVQSFGRSSDEKLSDDMTLASYNEFKKPDDNLKQNPSQIQSKRTKEERAVKMMYRRKKKILAALNKRKPRQSNVKFKLEKELKELELGLRRLSEKCYQQRQMDRLLTMPNN